MASPLSSTLNMRGRFVGANESQIAISPSDALEKNVLPSEDHEQDVTAAFPRWQGWTNTEILLNAFPESQDLIVPSREAVIKLFGLEGCQAHELIPATCPLQIKIL